MADNQVIRWCMDLGMGITFFLTFVTGLFKWTLLIRSLGLTSVVFPVALMSDIHDWAGFLLGLFVALHLISNRVWITTMAKRIFSGRSEEQNSR
jgi:hypothetical protein